MKHLIVYSHPNPKSLSHALLETAIEASRAKGVHTDVRDLYAQNFNPVLSAADFVAFQSGKIPDDIAREQAFVRDADLITLIYPIWWTGLPAMLHGYIDRVFSHGFAFRYGAQGAEGLLKGKKALAFTPHGTPTQYYEASGMLKSMAQTQDDGILKFCGIEVIKHAFLGGATSTTDEVRKGWLEDTRKTVTAALG